MLSNPVCSHLSLSFSNILQNPLQPHSSRPSYSTDCAYALDLPSLHVVPCISLPLTFTLQIWGRLSNLLGSLWIPMLSSKLLATLPITLPVSSLCSVAHLCWWKCWTESHAGRKSHWQFPPSLTAKPLIIFWERLFNQLLPTLLRLCWDHLSPIRCEATKQNLSEDF